MMKLLLYTAELGIFLWTWIGMLLIWSQMMMETSVRALAWIDQD